MAHARGRQSIFISHISDEERLAGWLKSRLDQDFLGALDIFVSSDRPTIAAGSRWLDEVEKALKGADLQVILCSPESVRRPWVNFEAGAVWLRGIKVVPVCHSSLTPEKLPLPLSLLEGIAIGDSAGLAKLYDAVASALALRVPHVDFAAIAAEARTLEADYASRAARVDVIDKPRLLCAASAQFAQPTFEFELDVEVVHRYFTGRVTVDRQLTSERLMDWLATERFDIVHLVLPVDPVTGALIFSPVIEATHEADAGADTMLPASFASLLVESKTRLVVLATCKALLLAVEVANVANMAASDQDISGREAAAWCDTFYKLLAQQKSVFKAFDMTRQLRPRAPIRAVRHQDVIFAPGTAGLQATDEERRQRN